MELLAILVHFVVIQTIILASLVGAVPWYIVLLASVAGAYACVVILIVGAKLGVWPVVEERDALKEQLSVLGKKCRQTTRSLGAMLSLYRYHHNLAVMSDVPLIVSVGDNSVLAYDSSHGLPTGSEATVLTEGKAEVFTFTPNEGYTYVVAPAEIIRKHEGVRCTALLLGRLTCEIVSFSVQHGLYLLRYSEAVQ